MVRRYELTLPGWPRFARALRIAFLSDFHVGSHTGDVARLAAIDAGHLFEPTTTHIAIRRDSYLRDYMYDFILMIAPNWTREAIDRVIKRASDAAAA